MSSTVRSRRSRTITVLLLLAALPLVITLAIMLGSVTVSPDRVWGTIVDNLFFGGAASAQDNTIIWVYRVPRVFLAAIIGAMLAIAGAALQALVRNPLADPYVLGVSSGASLGAVIVMSLGSAAVAGLSVSASAFTFAVVVLVVVYFFAQKSGAFTDTRIVLAGVAVGYIAMAITNYFQLQAAPGELRSVMFWLMGSVSGARWESLPIPAVTLLVIGFVLFARSHAMNAMALSDTDAIAVGVNLRRFRIWLLILASALTAVSVSFAGGIGFIGLIVPHIVRLLHGPDHRLLIPLSALLGAILLILVDLIARTVDSPNEYPITIFTALIGGPFFLWLMRSRRTTI